MTKRLLAKITTGPNPPGSREVVIALRDEAATLADKLNAALACTDGELMIIAWTLGTGMIEAAIDGFAINMLPPPDGHNPIDLDPLGIASHIRDQLRATGKLTLEET